MAQTLKEKTVTGFFWGGFNNIFQQIIQLGFGIFMARLLSPNDFGLVGLLTIFTLLATVIQESGFAYALMNKKQASQTDFSSVFWFNIVISISLYIILFFSSPLIAGFFDQPLLIPLSKVVFLTFVFNAFGLIQNTILTKEIQMKRLAIVNLSSVIISCSVGLILALLGFSYWAFAIQGLCLAFVKTIVLWLVSSWRPSPIFNIYTLKEMFPFSVKILFSNIVSQISNGLYSFLLGKYYNEEQVGYYTQAYRWYAIPSQIIYGIINTTAYPVLAEVNDDPQRQRQVFRKMLRFTSFLSFPLVLGFAFIAEELIPILVTEKWNPSIPIIQLLCIWGAFLPLVGLYTNVLTTRGYSGILFVLATVYGLLLILVLVLTVDYGIIAMIQFTLIIHFLYSFAIVLSTRKRLGFLLKDFAKDVFPFLGSALFVFLVVSLPVCFLKNVYLILLTKIGLSIFLYILLMRIANIVIFQEVVRFLKQKVLTKP